MLPPPVFPLEEECTRQFVSKPATGQLLTPEQFQQRKEMLRQFNSEVSVPTVACGEVEQILDYDEADFLGNPERRGL